MIIEISTETHESYWEISDKQLKAIIKLSPSEADTYIRQNCKEASIHHSDDVEVSFASNCEPYEWEEFVKEVKAYLDES